MILALLKDLKSTQGIDFRYIHCDTAGENEYLEQLCKQEGMSMKVEYTDLVCHNKMLELSKNLMCFIKEFALC